MKKTFVTRLLPGSDAIREGLSKTITLSAYPWAWHTFLGPLFAIIGLSHIFNAYIFLYLHVSPTMYADAYN